MKNLLKTPVSLNWKQQKEVYPTKHHMNLYFKEDRTTAPATIALYVMFALAVCVALFKVMFYDVWSTAKHLELQAMALEQRTTAQMQELKDYPAIKEQYTLVAATEEEESTVDRMQLLEHIDQTIRPHANISQISITDNKVLLIFSGVTLERAAELVADLQQSPLVTRTSVDTAVTTREGQSLVEVHVYFEVAPEEAQS